MQALSANRRLTIRIYCPRETVIPHFTAPPFPQLRDSFRTRKLGIFSWSLRATSYVPSLLPSSTTTICQKASTHQIQFQPFTSAISDSHLTSYVNFLGGNRVSKHFEVSFNMRGSRSSSLYAGTTIVIPTLCSSSMCGSVATTPLQQHARFEFRNMWEMKKY
jgi:hypothetical protein